MNILAFLSDTVEAGEQEKQQSLAEALWPLDRAVYCVKNLEHLDDAPSNRRKAAQNFDIVVAFYFSMGSDATTVLDQLKKLKKLPAHVLILGSTETHRQIAKRFGAHFQLLPIKPEELRVLIHNIVEGVSMAKTNNVLIVDDEQDLLNLYVRVLQAAGHEVTACSLPSKALEAARQQRFDLLVTDFNMPEMDGSQMLSAMRDANTLPQRVLVITGRPDNIPVIEALGLLNCRCLMKPLRSAQVTAAVNGLLAIDVSKPV